MPKKEEIDEQEAYENDETIEEAKESPQQQKKSKPKEPTMKYAEVHRPQIDGIIDTEENVLYTDLSALTKIMNDIEEIKRSVVG